MQLAAWVEFGAETQPDWAALEENCGQVGLSWSRNASGFSRVEARLQQEWAELEQDCNHTLPLPLPPLATALAVVVVTRLAPRGNCV